MNTRVLLAIVAVTFTPPGARAQGPIAPPGPAPAHIDMREVGASMPMQNLGGRPVIELQINGQGPFRFLLDTGAPISIIGEDLSRELKLRTPEVRDVTAQDVPGPPPTVTIGQVRIGEAEVDDLTAIVAPAGMLLHGADAPRGILSAASFPGYLLTFDYPGKRITLRKGSLPEADSQSIFQYSENQDLPTIPIRIAGTRTDVHLDTGSPFGLTLPLKFLSQLPPGEKPRESGKVRTGGGGEFPLTVARVGAPLEIGQFRIDAGQVNFCDAQPGPFPGPPIGNVGYEVLRQFVLTIDSKNRRVQLRQ